MLGQGELLSAVEDRRQSYTLGETERRDCDGWTAAKCRDRKNSKAINDMVDGKVLGWTDESEASLFLLCSLMTAKDKIRRGCTRENDLRIRERD